MLIASNNVHLPLGLSYLDVEKSSRQVDPPTDGFRVAEGLCQDTEHASTSLCWISSVDVMKITVTPFIFTCPSGLDHCSCLNLLIQHPNAYGIQLVDGESSCIPLHESKTFGVLVIMITAHRGDGRLIEGRITWGSVTIPK